MSAGPPRGGRAARRQGRRRFGFLRAGSDSWGMRLLVITILVCAAGVLLVEVAMIRATKAQQKQRGRPAVQGEGAPEAGGRGAFLRREPGESPEDVLIRVYRSSPGPDARIRAIQALGRIPTATSRRFLEEAAREDPAALVRDAARSALEDDPIETPGEPGRGR